MPNISGKGWAFAAELTDAFKETEHYQQLLSTNPMVDPSEPAIYVGSCYEWPPHRYTSDNFSEAGHSILRKYGHHMIEGSISSSRSEELALLREVEDRECRFRGLGHAVVCSPQVSPSRESSSDHHVYVIRLPDEAKENARIQSRVRDDEPDPEMPCVYVGETSTTGSSNMSTAITKIDLSIAMKASSSLPSMTTSTR